MDLNFDARAGRWLGNPELEVTVTEEATGEEVAFGADRQPFGVSWITPCDEAANCGGTYRIDLALAVGREAEIDWSAGLSYSSMPEDSDAEPLVGTLEISD